MKMAARLIEPKSGRIMEVRTTATRRAALHRESFEEYRRLP